MEELTRGLLEFLNSSPTAYHAAENAAQQLLTAGYTELREYDTWQLTSGGSYFVRRGEAALIAFRVPCEKPDSFLLSAAHSDSPALKIRENAELTGPGGCIRLSVEPYGGGIWRSWMDRPLSVAGRVMVRQEGSIVSRLVCIDRDLLMIPSVAIHMNREVNKNGGVQANVDLVPLFAQGKESGIFRRLVAEAAGVAEEDLLTTELYLYNRTPATLLGANEEFVAGPHLDDLQSVYGCLQGFLAARSAAGKLPVLCIFHNEEVGSLTRQGADSTFLPDVLERVTHALGMSREEYLAAVADSFLVSADNAHATHPNHPEYADPNESPALNGGIVLKYNANQHYTTDAVSAAVFTEICRRAEASIQRFSNRADLPGGSTLGNISIAHLSVTTVDIGLPQLAMHSSYELAGAADLSALVKAMTAYYGCDLRHGPDGGIRL